MGLFPVAAVSLYCGVNIDSRIPSWILQLPILDDLYSEFYGWPSSVCTTDSKTVKSDALKLFHLQEWQKVP